MIGLHCRLVAMMQSFVIHSCSHAIIHTGTSLVRDISNNGQEQMCGSNGSWSCERWRPTMVSSWGHLASCHLPPVQVHKLLSCTIVNQCYIYANCMCIFYRYLYCISCKFHFGNWYLSLYICYFKLWMVNSAFVIYQMQS